MLFEKYTKILAEVKPETDLELKLQSKISKLVYEFDKTHNTLSESVELYLKPLSIEDINYKPVAEVYAAYCEWCKLNYLTPETIKKFSKGVRLRFNVETINTTRDGKKVTVYRVKKSQ